MVFRCPSCGFQGRIRIPDYYPWGKKASVRCSRCQRRFVLVTGRRWPQDSEDGYRAMLSEAPACRGERIGHLRVEVLGQAAAQPPVVVLQGHPGFPHGIMHDLLNPLAERARLCFLDFTGREAAHGELFLKDLRALLARIDATECHLIGHLHTVPLALETAIELGPRVCRSLVLISPDLAGVSPPEKVTPVPEVEDLLYPLLREDGVEPLEPWHLRGLARLMAPAASRSALDTELAPAATRLGYGRLSRLAVPVLLLASRDGSGSRRDDARYLQCVLPAATMEELDRGGAWAPWFSAERVIDRIGRFILRTGERPAPAEARRSSKAAGLPAGWVALAALLLGWGIAALLSGVAYQPDFMRPLAAALVGALLPVTALLLPRGLPLSFLFRLERPRSAGLLSGLLAGVLIGGAWSLLMPLLEGALPVAPPAFLLSLPAASPGRPLLPAALLPAALLSFGFLGNQLLMRRSRGLIMAAPWLLFLLLPPGWPDVAWKLPFGLAMAFLFRRGLSAWPVLSGLGGLTAATAAGRWLLSGRLPAGARDFLLTPVAGSLAAALLLLLAAAFLPLSPYREVTPEERYPDRVLARAWPWNIGWGTLAVILSLASAAIFLAGFLRVGL